MQEHNRQPDLPDNETRRNTKAMAQRAPLSFAPVRERAGPSPEALEMAVKQMGLTGYRPHQREAIEAALLGKDCLLVLPTGTPESAPLIPFSLSNMNGLCFTRAASRPTDRRRQVFVLRSPCYCRQRREPRDLHSTLVVIHFLVHAHARPKKCTEYSGDTVSFLQGSPW